VVLKGSESDLFVVAIVEVELRQVIIVIGSDGDELPIFPTPTPFPGEQSLGQVGVDDRMHGHFQSLVLLHGQIA